MAPPRSRKTRETWGTPASIYLNSSLASTGNKKQHETIRPWYHLTTSRFTDSRTNAAISIFLLSIHDRRPAPILWRQRPTLSGLSVVPTPTALQERGVFDGTCAE